jgi:hypothetical protein
MCPKNNCAAIKFLPTSFFCRHCLVILLIVSFYRGVIAEFISLPLISSGFSWEASTDNKNWIPAYPEYPNNLTFPFPATTDAVFMWYWNVANRNPTGTNGPNTVYFRSTFMLSDLHGLSAGAWIASDDWMDFRVNGVSAGTYQLDLNFNSGGQPTPKRIDFTNLLNTRYQGDMTGYNTITIEAHDGGPVAYERGYEWLFFDAHDVNTVPILDSPAKWIEYQKTMNVPEPTIFFLIMFGTVLLLFVRFVKKNMQNVSVKGF